MRMGMGKGLTVAGNGNLDENLEANMNRRTSLTPAVINCHSSSELWAELSPEERMLRIHTVKWAQIFRVSETVKDTTYDMGH